MEARVHFMGEVMVFYVIKRRVLIHSFKEFTLLQLMKWGCRSNRSSLMAVHRSDAPQPVDGYVDITG